MPLLISSRMTSAGLTASSSASSFTVIVGGSSIAPRSRGSIVWTAVWPPSTRRGGLRGPRRPRVPLLLLATGSSFGVRGRRSRHERLAKLWRDRCLERPPEGAALDGSGPAAGIPAEVCASAGDAAGLIDDHLARRGPDDPHQLTLRTRGPARDARTRRQTTRRLRDRPAPTRSPAGAGRRAPRRCRVDAYDATSPLAAVFFARGFLIGAASVVEASAPTA